MHSKSLSRITRIVIVSASLALLAAVPASAQMASWSQPYSGTTWNPCNGEYVEFSGTIHFHTKTQVSSDGRIHYVANNNFSASGLGLSTGASYNIGGTMHTNSKFPSFPITFRQRNRFISYSSTAPSFNMTVAYHVNGSGQQTNVTSDTDCK